MTNIQSFPMPDVGEGLTEAEVLTWHVGVGDTLTVNQIMVEIETAKAAVELPSPYAGTVTALLVQPGVVVEVGTPIISIDTDGGAVGAQDRSTADGAVAVAAPAGGPGGPDDAAGPEPGAKIGEMTADGRIATLVGYVSAGPSSSRRPRRPPALPAVDQPSISQPAEHAQAPRAAPPVRKLAKGLGVDLHTVRPARADGVISRAEVEAAAVPADRSAPVAASGAARSAADAESAGPREHRIPIRGIRKQTAQAMVASAFTAPHVTEFLTVDVTPMMELRDRLRRRPEFAEVRIGPLAFTALAVCTAARRTPEINAVWDGDAAEIVVKHYVNLGIAAATPRGLIVPVIPDAHRLDLHQLAVALGELTATARAGRTAPAQLTGGTFTITNVGTFGVDTGTPIINPGESAILALGSIKDAPWVVDGRLAVRKVCQLALSFDHRVVDGQQGSQFLADVGALLADPALGLAF